MPPRHEANIPVRMSSDGTRHPSRDWAIEPRILEPGVMAARMLLSNGHEEMVSATTLVGSTLLRLTAFLGSLSWWIMSPGLMVELSDRVLLWTVA